MDAVGHGRQLSAGQWDRPGRGRGSSSSPPRGLREAYARIVDEENLAAAESPPLPDEATEDHEEDDAVSIDRTGRHLLVPHDHRHEHHLQAERARALASPRALPFPVRPSGHVERHRHQGTLPEADHPQELDDGTVGSSSLSGSTVSGLSSLENGTDDSFVRTLATHRRDQRRVKGALTNGQPVFSRALHGDANGLTSEDLRPRDRLDRILVAENEVAEEAASLASNHSDSAIHLPNGWGRRNRRRREWLRQTATHSDGDDGGRRLHIPREDKPPDPAREPSHQDDDASAIDWLAAGADTPLPSVEADSSTDGTALSSDSNPSRSTRPPAASSADRPPPPHPEPDLTARSLVTSRSPIIRAKLTVLERIREREMEALKGQALTRNRLDQIRERSTPEPLRSRQRSGQADDDDEQGRDDDRDGPRSSGPASPRSEHAPFKSAREEGANDGSSSSVVPASDQAQPDPPPAHPAPRPANEAPDLQHPPNKGQPARARADRTKTDSRDLLRQLARAASNSPSPKLDAARPAPAEAESDGPSARQPPDHSNAVVSDPRPPGVDDDDDDSGLDDGLEDLTPRAEKGPMGVATPAIAVGGWVDTPAGRGQAIHHPLSSPSSSSSSSSPSTDLAVRRGLSKFKVRDLLDRRGPGSLAHERKKGQAPPQDDHERARPDKTSHVLPPSTDVTNMPSRDDMEIDLTMDSLDRLIADETLDFTASNLIPDPDPAALVDLRRSKDQPANEIDGDGQLDKVTYDRMNRRLRTLLLSIRDAKHGIDVLEDRVGRTDDDSVRACPECGRHLAALCSRHDRPWYHRFRIPFLTVYRRTNDGKHLLTWFGLIWLTVWGYLLAELLTWYVFYFLLHASPPY